MRERVAVSRQQRDGVAWCGPDSHLLVVGRCVGSAASRTNLEVIEKARPDPLFKCPCVSFHPEFLAAWTRNFRQPGTPQASSYCVHQRAGRCTSRSPLYPHSIARGMPRRTAQLSAKRRSQKPGSRNGGVPHEGRAEWKGYLSQTCCCIRLRPLRSVSELVALASFETLLFVVLHAGFVQQPYKTYPGPSRGFADSVYSGCYCVLHWKMDQALVDRV